MIEGNEDVVPLFLVTTGETGATFKLKGRAIHPTYSGEEWEILVPEARIGHPDLPL